MTSRPPAPPPPPPPPPLEGGEATAFRPLALLIDADGERSRLLEVWLEELGCEFQTFQSADGARTAMSGASADRRPDLVVCESDLPGTQGAKLRSHMRLIAQTTEVPFFTYPGIGIQDLPRLKSRLETQVKAVRSRRRLREVQEQLQVSVRKMQILSQPPRRPGRDDD